MRSLDGVGFVRDRASFALNSFMSVIKPPLPPASPETPASERLDSWKEIAGYLKRDERTVRRWEKDGLQVHRHRNKKKAEVFERSERFDQAIAMYSRFRELTARGAPEPSAPSHVRDSKTYWSWMRAVLQKDSARTSVSPLDLAEVNAALGQKDHAFALLNEAVKERAGELAFLRVSPSWDPLREDPRFRDLVRTVGLSGNLNHAPR